MEELLWLIVEQSNEFKISGILIALQEKYSFIYSDEWNNSETEKWIEWNDVEN